MRRLAASFCTACGYVSTSGRGYYKAIVHILQRRIRQIQSFTSPIYATHYGCWLHNLGIAAVCWQRAMHQAPWKFDLPRPSPNAVVPNNPQLYNARCIADVYHLMYTALCCHTGCTVIPSSVTPFAHAAAEAGAVTDQCATCTRRWNIRHASHLRHVFPLWNICRDLQHTEKGFSTGGGVRQVCAVFLRRVGVDSVLHGRGDPHSFSR